MQNFINQWWLAAQSLRQWIQPKPQLWFVPDTCTVSVVQKFYLWFFCFTAQYSKSEALAEMLIGKKLLWFPSFFLAHLPCKFNLYNVFLCDDRSLHFDTDTCKKTLQDLGELFFLSCFAITAGSLTDFPEEANSGQISSRLRSLSLTSTHFSNKENIRRYRGQRLKYDDSTCHSLNNWKLI